MSDLRVRLILDSENNASGGVRELRNDARDLDSQMGLLEQRFNQFIAFKVGEVSLQWAESLIKTADTYQTLEAKLERVTDSYSEQMTVQKALFDISQEAMVKLTLAEDTYIKNADAIKRMGGNTEQALRVTETLAKVIASTSGGIEKDAAVLTQWGDALGAGALNGDELKSILENSLGLAQALADGMGIPIGKMKELGAEGKLTSVDLINALIKQEEAVDKIFKAVPITVAQGATAIVNAWTVYIGEADKSLGATRALADGLVEVSKHLPAIAEGTLLLAGIYGVKLTAGLAAYIDHQLVANAASAAAVAAAEHETVANLELLRVQSEVAAMRVNAARLMMEESRLQLALAATIPPMIASEQLLATTEVAAAESMVAASQAQLAAAQSRVAIAQENVVASNMDADAVAYLSAAMRILVVAEEEAIASTAALTAAETRMAVATEAAAAAQAEIIATSTDAAAAQGALAAATRSVAVAEEAATAATITYRNALNPIEAQTTLAATAATGLNWAFAALLAGWGGWEIGSFLRKFESVRWAGSYLAESVHEWAVTWGHFLSGDFLDSEGDSLTKKLLDVERGYDEVRESSTEAAQAEAERAAKVKEFLKQEEIKRTENFKTLQSQLKETSTQVDAEYTRQTNTIKTALEQQKNAIAASALPEIQKEAAISKAIADANAARLLAIQEAADKKLQLIAHVYDAELAKLKAGTIEQKAVEKQSIEERIALYTSLEKNYQQVIDGLISDEQRHAQAVKQLLNDRENLEQGTQDAIRHIRQAGMDDEHLLADQQKELDENLAKSRQALIAGDTDNAKKYGEEAAKLAQQLATQAESAYKAGRGYSSEAERFITKFKDARKSISDALEKEQSAHQEQQAALSKSISESQTKLDSTKTKINELSTTLRDKFLLKINADTSAVDSAIARIEKPTESVHTIHVVEDNTATGDPNWTDGKTKRAIKRDGNSFSYDYESVDDAPQGLQDGGFPRVTGLLPGYGGGDKIPALLEEGEFVLNKEAVAKNGAAAIHALNNGDARVNRVLQLSAGGMASLFPGINGNQLVNQQTESMVDSAAKELVKNFGFYDNAKQLKKFGASDLQVDRVNYILSLYKDAAKKGEGFFYNSKKLLADSLLDHVTDPANPDASTLTKIQPREVKKVDFALPQSVVNVAAASSQLQSSSSSRHATVEFKFPNSSSAPIVGHFKTSEVDQLLSSLKDAAGLSIAGSGSSY